MRVDAAPTPPEPPTRPSRSVGQALPDARDVVHPALVAAIGGLPVTWATRFHTAWFDLLERAVAADDVVAVFGIVVGRPGTLMHEVERALRAGYPTADDWLLLGASELADDLGLAPELARRIIGADEVLAAVRPAVHTARTRDRTIVAAQCLSVTLARLAGAVRVGADGAVADADRRPFLTGRLRAAVAGPGPERIGPFVTAI